MPTTTCACSTGNGSTLGLLSKHWGVRTGPALRQEKLELSGSKTSAVPDGAGPLWPESARKQEKAEKSEKETKPLL
jgi:hypothetical protein